MKYIFLLSGENPELAKEEVLSLTDAKNYFFIDKLLIVEMDNKKIADELAKRLAYTHNIYQCLFECKNNDLAKNMQNFNWDSVYKENFCLRINGKTSYKEKDLAGHIWAGLKKPKVNLENPKTSIEFFILEKKIYVTKLIKELKHDFQSREAHKRPELHPTALNPKLARALINLSGAEKEVI